MCVCVWMYKVLNIFNSLDHTVHTKKHQEHLRRSHKSRTRSGEEHELEVILNEEKRLLFLAPVESMEHSLNFK